MHNLGQGVNRGICGEEIRYCDAFQPDRKPDWAVGPSRTVEADLITDTDETWVPDRRDSKGQ